MRLQARLRAACTALLLTVALGPAARAQETPRVVLISVDGLRADVVSTASTPNIAALAATGVSAAQAVNDLPSATLPNHASMLTGLIGDVHGVIFDFSLPGRIATPTVFDYAHAAGKRCAFFASKTKLEFLAPPEVLEDFEIADPPFVAERVRSLLTADGPDLIFLHLREPDSTGHRFGWLSDEYMQAAADMDALIGEIAAAVDADASRPTFLIVTADHGGSGMGHGRNNAEDRSIPWIVHRPGVVPGGQIQDVVSIVDTAPTALWLLGLEVPDGLSGKARTEVLDANAVVGDNFVVPPVGIPCLLFAVTPALLGLWLHVRAARGAGRAARDA